VEVTQDISAGVTSDPSQPTERAWAGLSSPEVEVPVLLEEAMLTAGTRRESRSPVLIIPTKAGEKREVSLSGIQLSPMLAGTKDLPRQLN
jgi:hypothetical protein